MKMNAIATMLLPTTFVFAAAVAQAQDRNPGVANGAAQTSPGAGTASGVACNERGITILESSAMKMSNGSMKTSAMSEIKMAKDAMAKKDEKMCMTHLDKANQMIRKP